MITKETRHAARRCFIDPKGDWPAWYRPPSHGARTEDWPLDARQEAGAHTLAPTGFPVAAPVAPAHRNQVRAQAVPAVVARRQAGAAAQARPVAVEAALATFRMFAGLPVFDLNAAAAAFLPAGARRVSAAWMGQNRIAVYRNISGAALQLVGESGRCVPALALLGERLGHGLQLGERFPVTAHPGNSMALIIDLTLPLPPARAVFR